MRQLEILCKMLIVQLFLNVYFLYKRLLQLDRKANFLKQEKYLQKYLSSAYHCLKGCLLYLLVRVLACKYIRFFVRLYIDLKFSFTLNLRENS